MDALPVLTLLLAFSGAISAQSLKCIECSHIGYKTRKSFTGADNIYTLINNKYNIRCTQENPYAQALDQNNQNNNNNQFFPGNQIRETVCPAQTDINKCNLIYGNVTFTLKNQNNAQLVVEMYVRNCITETQMEPGKCYDRRNLPSDKRFFEEYLSFLGIVTVNSYTGRQCVCNTDLCYALFISASRGLHATLGVILVALIFSIWSGNE